MNLESFDRSLMAATQTGLPLEPHPYDVVGAQLGVTGAVVRERLAAMLAKGLIRRIGAVPNHYRLGFTANGMTVWDVDDTQVDTLGMKVGALPFVSHCYRRPRVLPDWPYNLFAMVHGRSRAAVERFALEIHCLLGGAARSFDILYSTRILKKSGVRIAAAAG
jgi:DNA-binding Lrp family transcriptional regulator